MDCEVAVVGAGIGGLTVAALLAKRGVNVCVFERNSLVGGCVANFEKFGYTFEPAYGLYSSWGENDVYDRLFAELDISRPEVRPLAPAYVVRLPDGCDVTVGSNPDEFEQIVSAAFPECAAEAQSFYRDLYLIANASQRANHETSGRGRSWLRSLAKLRDSNKDSESQNAASRRVGDKLGDLSFRFRRFLDVQLQAFGQVNTDEASYLFAARALTAAQEGMFAISGGAATLANKLADAIATNGGRVRLNAPVLRLAYDRNDVAVGLDLLSGERVTASKAIVSNLTIWDTYGKLIGLSRTPTEVRSRMNELRSYGSYLLFLGMDEAAAAGLRSEHVLGLTDWQRDTTFDPEGNQFMFSAAPSWDPRAPEGKRAVVVQTFTDVQSWFTFHTDETEEERNDQQMLERVWERLHGLMPELGSSVEVIETATPRTFYEQTRRKLGMAGGIAVTPAVCASRNYNTSQPNVFLIGDTISPGGLAVLTEDAVKLARQIL